MPHKDPQAARAYYQAYREQNLEKVREGHRRRQQKFRAELKRKKQDAQSKETAVCSQCRQQKPLIEFHDASWCKLCKSEHDSEYRAEHREKLNSQKRAHYAENRESIYTGNVVRRYGLTPDELAALLASQKNACAICGETPEKRLSVDHDHDTGRVRGLLCGRCNTGLGLFRDRGELLLKAARYLEPQ